MSDAEEKATPPLFIEKDDAVTTITINDAPWNRMSLEFMDALEALVEKLAADTSVRAVVIQGNGVS